MFCADDGTRLISEPAPAGPFNASPASQPRIADSAPFTPPAATGYQPTPKKRKWLAVIALVLGILALPFLLFSLSQEILWEYGFRNLSLDRLLMSAWGVTTVLGTILLILSVIVGLVAIVLSMKQPARYGGKALAVVGPVLSILLMAIVVGVFAFRRMQGNTYEIFNSNSNSNSNDNSSYNSNRSSNYNSASNSNYNSNSSDSTSESSSMSETDKYRLFYAAAKSGDTDLQQRAAKKIGIVESNGMPTSTYQSFIKGTINWAFTDRAWVQTMDTPAKGRAYALERL